MGLCQSIQGTNRSFHTAYALGEQVGSGATATVHIATHKRGGKRNEEVAVKCIDRTKFSKKETESLLKEVEYLRMCSHPHIITFHDFFDNEKEKYFLVVEMIRGGELFDRISEKTVYTEKNARDLIMKLLDVLSHLNDRGIVHRDLKPENLLLKRKDDDSDFVLIDFGFAEKCEGRNLTHQCGTPNYVAPEILAKRRYGVEVDIWSVGVIAYILLGGYPPFYSETNDNDELFRKISDADYKFDPEWWRPISPNAKDLIRKLLVVDQNTRLTAAQALRHEWFLAADHELAEASLEKSLEQFKSWNARRKFKGAVKAVMLAGKLRKLTSAVKSAAANEESNTPHGAPPNSY